VLARPPHEVLPQLQFCRTELPSSCHDCVARRASRAHCFASMGGPCRQLARQSIAPRALHVAGGPLRGRQRFISEGPWDEAQRRWHSHQRVAEELGEPDGVRRGEATGCGNKGQDSVGVAWPSCGPLGKVEHGQGGVCAG